MARKKSKAASSAKQSKGRRSGGNDKRGAKSKPTIFENKVQYAGYAVIVAIIGILALFFVLSSSSSTSSSTSTSTSSSTATAITSSSKKNQSSVLIQKDEKNDKKEAFLKWFIDNGGIFHPISIPSLPSPSSSSSSTSNNNRTPSVNVTIEEFPSYGGWGLALPIPILPPEPSSLSSSSSSSSCQLESTDGQCAATSSASSSSAAAASSDNEQTPPSSTIIIHHLDPLFTIPSTLILSIESIIDTYALSSSSPLHLLNHILISRGAELFPREHHQAPVGVARRGMGLVQQDIVIGLHLMVEECHYLHADLFNNDNDDDNNGDDDDYDDDDWGRSSRASHWGPYLDILPQYTIPRLDTFDDEEYAALKDEKLEYTGRNSRRVLERLYYSNDDDDGGGASGGGGGSSSGPSLKTVLQAMIRQKNGPTSLPLDVPETCLRFETFHRFVGIVSSRAMVLKGVKYLTPLAEMINYSPKVGTTVQQHHEKKKGEDHIRAPFDLYHSLSPDNSITVRSDRDIILDDNTASTSSSATATSIQLFEDYGPVDSSLFLEAHGFVPHENPNNCAMISGSSFLRHKSAVGRHDENVILVLQALKALHLIHPQVRELDMMLLEDVCVKSDSEMVDDGNTVGRRPASDSIAITSLVLGDSHDNSNNNNLVWNRIENKYGETFVSLREKCLAAIRSVDTERMEIRCARYPGSDGVVKDALRTASGRSIKRYEEDGDTEEKLVLQLQQAELEGRDRLAVALRFRIEERKILSQIADSTGVGDDEKEVIVTEQMEVESSESVGNLEAKLIAFNTFVESLDLPLNKIEPKLVGDGMRIGTCATEDLEVGDAYISLPANSVIDVTTALAGVDDKSSDFASLLRKYSELNTPYNDGFDTLLLYLLHERFLLKEQSRWWPYLDLLPSIEELSTFHPLFFEEEEMNRYLAGSDFRGFILRYQQRAADRHAALSSDLDANLVLGSDVLLDKEKVYWANAIIDSRSIWWGGKRHISPLLDLVNADSQGAARETKLEDSEDVNQKLAVTRASRHIGKGEQVFENYAQPNYLLFAYHGFLLEDNANDCALLDGLFVRRNDPGAKSAHLLRSRTPTFCIRDLASIEELAHFLRVKHGLASGNSSAANLDDDVRPLLIDVLEGRVARLMEAMSNDVDKETFALPRLNLMRQMVKNDLMHFQHALKTHVLVQN